MKVSSTSRLERKLEELVAENGIDAVLAALCQLCLAQHRTVLFRKLNRVYEWMVKP
jgi:hypothetical protein